MGIKSPVLRSEKIETFWCKRQVDRAFHLCICGKKRNNKEVTANYLFFNMDIFSKASYELNECYNVKKKKNLFLEEPAKFLNV